MNVVPMPAVSDVAFTRKQIQQVASRWEQAICEAMTVAQMYPLFDEVATQARILADLRDAAQSRLEYLERQGE